MASSEPANTCNRHQPTQSKKTIPRFGPELQAVGSQSGSVSIPVQDCSPPNQRSSSKGSHGGAEKQENAKRDVPADRSRPRSCLPRWFSSPHPPTINPSVKCHFFPTSESDLPDHECHRAQPSGRNAEPGGHATADADSSRDVAGAQTGRLGVCTASLARIPDGSGTARCLHGVGLRLRGAVRVSAVARPSGDHVPLRCGAC